MPRASGDYRASFTAGAAASCVGHPARIPVAGVPSSRTSYKCTVCYVEHIQHQITVYNCVSPIFCYWADFVHFLKSTVCVIFQSCILLKTFVSKVCKQQHFAKKAATRQRRLAALRGPARPSPPRSQAAPLAPGGSLRARKRNVIHTLAYRVACEF